MFALGIRNSPGSSTSAVDVVKLLRKRHLSSNKNELKNKASNVVIINHAKQQINTVHAGSKSSVSSVGSIAL